MIAGTRDPVGEESRGVQRLLDNYGQGGPRQGHPLLRTEDARHELVNETNRDEVTSDLIAWVVNGAQ